MRGWPAEVEVGALFARFFAEVAVAAEGLEVPGFREAAEGERDYVVDLKFDARVAGVAATGYTAMAVLFQYHPAQFFGDFLSIQGAVGVAG